MTHICVGKLTIISSDYGLSPGRRQVNFWTNAGLKLIRTLETNCREILSEIRTFSFQKIYLSMPSGIFPPFCFGLNALTWGIPTSRIIDPINITWTIWIWAHTFVGSSPPAPKEWPVHSIPGLYAETLDCTGTMCDTGCCMLSLDRLLPALSDNLIWDHVFFSHVATWKLRWQTDGTNYFQGPATIQWLWLYCTKATRT